MLDELVKEQEVVVMEVGKVIPYANNPRKNDEAAKKVAELMKRFGFRYAIHVDKDNVIISGHTRLKAAKILGLAKVPVVIDADLPAEDVKALRLADNRSNELALWDEDLLGSEMRELDSAGYDLGVLGFATDQLDELLTDPEEALANKKDKEKPHEVVLGRERIPVTDAEADHFLAMLADHETATGGFWGFVSRLEYDSDGAEAVTNDKTENETDGEEANEQ